MIPLYLDKKNELDNSNSFSLRRDFTPYSYYRRISLLFSHCRDFTPYSHIVKVSPSILSPSVTLNFTLCNLFYFPNIELIIFSIPFSLSISVNLYSILLYIIPLISFFILSTSLASSLVRLIS